ncbi:MAG TPA: MG2 domain-containing protein [Kofleriaceae bacterium]|nr:MG2 domain-containing protein [Kofleriaceae bacterium]
MIRSATLVASLALWMVALGCGNKKPDGADPGAATVQAQDVARGSDGAVKRTQLTAKALSPVVIQALGADDTVPRAIVIELAAPIVDKDAVGSPSARKADNADEPSFTITPPIKGTLVHTGVSELTFTPAEPFEFNTAYQLTLTSVDTVDGDLAPPPGERWTYAFKTPPFKFLGWAPSEADVDNRALTMDLAFSGPVLPNLALGAFRLTLDGRQIVPEMMPTGGELDHVRLKIEDNDLKVGSELQLELQGNLAAMNGKATLPATRATYKVTGDKAIAIRTAAFAETGNGFYVEVVCNDSAAAPGNRAYYDSEAIDGLSQRCQLSDDAIKHIHFTPEVGHVYLTGGRAGFRIFGDFKRGAYKMKIDAGATSLDGGVVLAPFARSFSVPARKPSLAFAASGRYLPRTAWTNLGIKHTNVDAASLTVRQVPAENLVFWLGEASDAASEQTSDVILKKTIPLRGTLDVPATSWLDVASLLPATTKGVLELKLAGLGTTATSRLLLTNLSLVAKKSAQGVRVWALDIDSAELQSGVEVSLVRKSGKVVAKCTTQGGDGCTLAQKPDDLDDAAPFALIARKGDDLTYLRYQDLKADVAESSTSGAPYVASSPYRASVYADRGVYRPGDTAHIAAIVRDAKDRAPDQPLPVDVQVIDPRAKVVRKLALKTNPAGAIALDQALPAFADTGHWRVDLTVADKPLASYDLQVEELVPERMKVTVAARQAEQLIGGEARFDVSAQYLFGGSALDSGVELTCNVVPARFAPDDNGDLTYGVPPKGKPVSLGQARGQIDPSGKLSLACPAPDGATPFTSTARLVASAAVLEAGSGRASVAAASALLHPEKFYLGVRSKAARVASGQPFTVEGAVVDWKGKLAPGATDQIHVELLHLEADYGYGFDDGSGESRYDRWLRPVPEGKLDVKVANGKFSFDVTPGDAEAGFVVRVTAGKARTELVLDGEYPFEYFNYGDGDHVDQTPRPAKPTQLAVKLPPEIKVGEAAKVTIRSPYRGKVLWTVETDHVIAAEWKDLAAGDAAWSFQLAAFAPNVYVSAFVVKDPHLESKDAFLPDRAFGVASVKVAPTALTQGVAISAPKEVRSSSPLAITLDIGKPDGPAFATVAVVDEGILQLTRFASPDPLAELFARRALAVETYETIGWTMLHQPAGASSKTGGGDEIGAESSVEGAGLGGAMGQSRVQPVKPVALFSGLVAIGADGKATIPFQIPQYRGQLRVMAVVATPGKIGHADAKVTVRDPLVVQTTFPRFVTQDDELQIPVFLTNVSGGPLEVQVSFKSETLALPGLAAPKVTTAPLVLTGKDAGTLKIADGFSETVVFQARANMAVGGARLHVVAHARGPAGTFDSKDDLDVPFLPSGPRDRAIQKVKLAAGALDLAAQPALKNWVPTSESTTLWMTANPYAESFQHLAYLVHYPYGCIEQTASATRPLLYVTDLVEQVDPQLAERKIEDMVLAGINRVFSMEAPSGGFGYWPGATEPLEWATAYATDMLLDAKKRGYAVPDDRLAGVMAWIEGRVAAYERGQHVAHQKWNHYDEQSEAYLHYVLARAGKAHKARIGNLIGKLTGKLSGEQAEDLYLLKAALFLAGDRRYEKDLKAVDTSPISAERLNTWSFYSDRRRRGLMLSTFFDLFGNDPAGAPLADRVAEGLVGQSSSWYNTQELVWGVTGLGKWVSAQLARSAVAGGTLTADGQPIKPRAARHASNDKAWSVMRASEYKQLALDVPASAAGLWLVIHSEGTRPGGDYKVGGNGMTVHRTYRDSKGTAIDPAAGTLKLGDLVFVELEIANTSAAEIQNVAVVDRLPAGFEVENPRLGRTTAAEWSKDLEMWEPEFQNLRDDHLEAFGRLPAKAVKHVIYTVRAVTSGKFTIPPVEVEAMYDATLWAREKGTTAVVGGPWTGKTL